MWVWWPFLGESFDSSCSLCISILSMQILEQVLHSSSHPFGVTCLHNFICVFIIYIFFFFNKIKCFASHRSDKKGVEQTVILLPPFPFSSINSLRKQLNCLSSHILFDLCYVLCFSILFCKILAWNFCKIFETNTFFDEFSTIAIDILGKLEYT